MDAAAEVIVARLLELEQELEKARRHREKWQARCSELEQAIDAFRLVARQMGIDVETAKQAAQPSTGHIARVVREAVGEIEEKEFTVKDVMRQRREELATVSTSSVSRVLIRMGRDGGLELVRRGSGKRPSIYRLPNSGGESGTTEEKTEAGAEVAQFRRREEAAG